MNEKKPPRISHRRKSRRLRPAAALLVALLTVGPIPAQFIVQQVNLAYLARRADVIVQGRVAKVGHKPLAGYKNIPTVEVSIDVEESLRGFPGKTYTFREVVLGPRINEGKRTYRVGQRVFLFLPSPSRYGLSSPVGIGQGRFHIAEDARGGARLVNEHGNAGLFRNVERDAGKAGRKLTAKQLRLMATEQGPVPLEDFSSLVKNLSTLPRIR